MYSSILETVFWEFGAVTLAMAEILEPLLQGPDALLERPRAWNIMKILGRTDVAAAMFGPERLSILALRQWMHAK